MHIIFTLVFVSHNKGILEIKKRFKIKAKFKKLHLLLTPLILLTDLFS